MAFSRNVLSNIIRIIGIWLVKLLTYENNLIA
jgi:hypothetical protein